MKIFTSAQIKELDKYTIENEPISSLNLMERAAQTMVRTITELWGSATPIVVFAGPGNNGGDGLAIARMLAELSGLCLPVQYQWLSLWGVCCQQEIAAGE